LGAGRFVGVSHKVYPYRVTSRVISSLNGGG
jgi:hypothetical protein